MPCSALPCMNYVQWPTLMYLHVVNLHATPVNLHVRPLYKLVNNHPPTSISLLLGTCKLNLSTDGMPTTYLNPPTQRRVYFLSHLSPLSPSAYPACTDKLTTKDHGKQPAELQPCHREAASTTSWPPSRNHRPTTTRWPSWS
jgi:hypothetical protein